MPVNAFGVANYPNLFARNERVVVIQRAAGGEVASAATAVAGAPAPTGAGPLKKKLEIDRCAMAICLPSPWAPSAAKRHVHHVCQL